LISFILSEASIIFEDDGRRGEESEQARGIPLISISFNKYFEEI
jgi:hypothetical protein